MVESRFEHYDANTLSEDTFRYDFFSAMEKEFPEFSHHKLLLEYPYSKLNKNDETNKKIDMLYDEDGKRIAVELKYFRETPGGHNANRTVTMAQLIADMFKLKSLVSTAYVILISTEEMLNYMRNNGYSHIFESKAGDALILGELNKKPDSFKKELMDKLGKNQWNEELNQIIVFKDYEFEGKKKEYCGFVFRVSYVTLPEEPIRNNYDLGAAMGIGIGTDAAYYLKGNILRKITKRSISKMEFDAIPDMSYVNVNYELLTSKCYCDNDGQILINGAHDLIPLCAKIDKLQR